jgi:hypothetical protein
MKIFFFTPAFFKSILFASLFFLPVFLMAEGSWPKEIHTTKSTVIIYQPEPDSMIGDHLFSRSAISFTNAKYPTPVFGAIWSDSRFSTDRESGKCTIYDVKILDIRFPGIDTIDPAKVEKFKNTLSEQATSWKLEYTLDELKSSLSLNQVAAGKTGDFNNDPPEIIYENHNSMLLLFDGDPVFKGTEESGIDRAVNTPFLVLKDKRSKTYYLYGANDWYKSADPLKATWTYVSNPPNNISNYLDELNKEVDYSASSSQSNVTKPTTGVGGGIPEIIVRTKPAELIQSDGEPSYAPIQGTQLLYMTNTDDNIFMTIDQNQYFILISGRWYRSLALMGPWTYIDSDKLPPDFARIPVGSEKDIVLASIAGTDPAKDAIMDAQIPQTAAVDRNTAQCTVEYDGDPQFEKISGTDIARAVNTSSTVLLYQNVFYVCDNAVWFVGNSPTGPWEVATSIPDEFQLIPPDDPAYNVRYVYIYDVEPDVVYIGYTPGYMGCYIYGSTIVYGTGWYYSPFYGIYYYPRPYTYGFGMNYNPWFGWSMGFYMSRGWFRYSYGERMHRHGGWWGPPQYRAPYHPRYDHYYGPRKPVYRGGNAVVVNDRRTNIYNKRTDGSVRPERQTTIAPKPAPNQRTGNQQVNERNKIETKPGKQEVNPAKRAAGKKNNIFTDNTGKVYRNQNGTWQENNGKDWNTIKPVPQGKSDEQTKQQERNPSPQPKPQQERVTSQPQPVRPAEQPRPVERVISTPARQPERNNAPNQQELQNQNSARERGVQNMNNRTSVQQTMPSGGGVSKGNTNDGRKR